MPDNYGLWSMDHGLIKRGVISLAKKGRILSGMQPTGIGKLHLGSLLGALSNWVEMQDDYECFYVIVDLHSLTSEYADTSKTKQNIREVLLDWLSVGLDPEKSTLFVQSQVPEHAVLHLLLSMITPLPWLERVPTYKGKIQELEGKRDLTTYGFLGYPLLQSADILIYKADTVPVGEDQLPHLELCREIARRFNHFYGEVFPLPQAKLTKAPKVLGTDGRKMGKSYENCIYIADPPDVLSRKVNSMFTDPEKIRLSDPGHPDTCVVYSYHQIYSEKKIKEIHSLCTSGKLGCVECKKSLSEKLISSLGDIQKRRQELEGKPERLEEILAEGARKARRVAKETLEEVKEAMKI